MTIAESSELFSRSGGKLEVQGVDEHITNAYFKNTQIQIVSLHRFLHRFQGISAGRRAGSEEK